MKKLILCLVAVCLMAAPIMAQAGQRIPGGGGSYDDPGGSGSQGPADDGTDHHSKPKPGSDDTPTRPVPEPGTMALASMGLIALGAAARRRRSSS